MSPTIQHGTRSDMSDEEIFDPKKYVQEVLVAFSQHVDAKLVEVDTKLEALEKQIATLVVGYGEQAVFMEALLAQLSFASEEQQKAFQRNVGEARKQMLKVMKDGAESLVAKQDERLASAITDVVDSKSSDS